MNTINLNHEKVFVSECEYGRTQDIEIRVGRQTFLMDIQKVNSHAHIMVYKKLGADRQKYSKYHPKAELKCVRVKPEAILDKRFFELIDKLEEAQRYHDCFANVLD